MGVYGTELPEGVSLPALVLQPSGGPALFDGSARLSSQRLDFKAYAETPKAANDLCREVHGIMRTLNRVFIDNSLVHSARQASGQVALRDPNLDLPFVYESYQIIFSEIEAA